MTFSLEAMDAILARPVPPPIPGQQTINVGDIWDHAYQGPGACKVETFDHICGAHRDEHQLVDHHDHKEQQ